MGIRARRDTLEELDVSWCRGVSGAWLGVLTDACANLRSVTLFGCTQVCPAQPVSRLAVLTLRFPGACTCLRDLDLLSGPYDTVLMDTLHVSASGDR